MADIQFCFSNLRYCYMVFFIIFLGIKTERDLKEILRSTIAKEILNKMRPRMHKSSQVLIDHFILNHANKFCDSLFSKE